MTSSLPRRWLFTRSCGEGEEGTLWGQIKLSEATAVLSSRYCTFSESTLHTLRLEEGTQIINRAGPTQRSSSTTQNLTSYLHHSVGPREGHSKDGGVWLSSHSNWQIGHSRRNPNMAAQVLDSTARHTFILWSCKSHILGSGLNWPFIFGRHTCSGANVWPFYSQTFRSKHGQTASGFPTQNIVSK